MKQKTIDALNYLEKWYEHHDSVELADCQVVYFITGHNGRPTSTIMINSILFKDGRKWNDMPERSGGDYRVEGIDILIESSKIVFTRHLLDRVS